jgi:hypothetical protein
MAWKSIMVYLLTFACYGCHLHGDEAGSVDRGHNVPGSPLVDAPIRSGFPQSGYGWTSRHIGWTDIAV